MESEGPLPHSQQSDTCPYPEPRLIAYILTKDMSEVLLGGS
jgi:hypothetical protein